MKRNEINIGDWVLNHADQSPVRIDTHWDIYNANVFDPIPISKDVLEKSGFEFFENERGCQMWLIDNFGEYNADSIFLRELKYNKKHKWAVDFSIYAEASGRIFIDYVHELQHILKMCKIDKEIKL